MERGKDKSYVQTLKLEFLFVDYILYVRKRIPSPFQTHLQLHMTTRKRKKVGQQTDTWAQEVEFRPKYEEHIRILIDIHPYPRFPYQRMSVEKEMLDILISKQTLKRPMSYFKIT